MSRNTKKTAWVILLMLVASCGATYMFYKNDRLTQKKEELSSELRLTQSKLNREQKEIVNLMVTIDSTVDKYKELESQHTQLKGEYQDLLNKVQPSAKASEEESGEITALNETEVTTESHNPTKNPIDADIAIYDKTEKAIAKETIKKLSFNGKTLREGESINLDVKFAPDSDILTDTFEIYQLAEFLQVNPTLTIKLSGHTEPNPPSNVPGFQQTSKMHLELSKRRVKSVERFLTTRGIPSKQIKTAYFGGTKPRYAVRKLNRRVELEIISR